MCWGGSHLFGDMLWFCILQELSPVLTGKAMLSNIFICPLEVERVRCPGNPLFVL